jgi:hypothetical protein
MLVVFCSDCGARAHLQNQSGSISARVGGQPRFLCATCTQKFTSVASARKHLEATKPVRPPEELTGLE